MSNKHEGWLLARLPEWEAEGLLPPEAVLRLREKYSPEGTERHGNLSVIIPACIGALLVGLGGISLLAANWAALSRLARGILALLPVCLCSALAFAAFFRHAKSRAFWEGLGIFWTLAIWGGFALVCQTYQLSDDVAGFTLACTLLCLPVVYLTCATGAILAWPCFLLAWLTARDNADALWPAVLALALLGLFLPAVLLRRRGVKHVAPYDFFAFGTFSLAVLFVLLHWQSVVLEKRLLSHWFVPESVLWMGCLLHAMGWLLDWKGMRRLSTCYFLPMVLAAPALEWHAMEWGNLSALAFLLVRFFFLLGLSLAAFRRGGTGEGEESSSGRWAIMAPFLAYGLCLFLEVEMLASVKLYFCVVLLAALALVHSLRKRRLLLMNQALCVLLYEILAKFFASNWSFTGKGIVLLVCGVLVLLSNLFVIRRRWKAEAKEVGA